MKITAQNVLLHYETNPTEISINGVSFQAHDYIAFDVEEGWAEFVARGKDGQLQHDGVTITLNIVRGVVVPNAKPLKGATLGKK